MSHPDWLKPNSLSSPQDRGDGIYKADMKSPQLTDVEV